VREVARRDKDARFTALLHHVDLVRLCKAYWAIRPQAAPGLDGVTWTEYGQDLEANLRDLHARVQAGRYRARPSRRVYIPKADGRQRPLGIASLEDKIVQRAVVEVLNAVYEVDFRGFSYGFRPGRKPHDALDALSVGITDRRVNWVLDADIRDFFGQLDHAWLRRFLRHRIADERVLRLIRRPRQDCRQIQMRHGGIPVAWRWEGTNGRRPEVPGTLTQPRSRSTAAVPGSCTRVPAAKRPGPPPLVQHAASSDRRSVIDLFGSYPCQVGMTAWQLIR